MDLETLITNARTGDLNAYAAVVDATSGLEAKTFGMVLTEIPPGSQSGLHRHTFEAVAYVLEGEGYDLIGNERIEVCVLDRARVRGYRAEAAWGGLAEQFRFVRLLLVAKAGRQR